MFYIFCSDSVREINMKVAELTAASAAAAETAAAARDSEVRSWIKFFFGFRVR